MTPLEIGPAVEEKLKLLTPRYDRVIVVYGDCGTGGRLDEVLLAGSFGTYINPESARVLGLVPPVPVARIKAVGNTASEGAKMALMSFREREVAAELPGMIEYVELSGTADFNDMFIANLGFPELDEVSAA